MSNTRLERPQRPRLLIITPVYNESEVLSRYVEEVRRVLFLDQGFDVNILFVDDGSVDGSWELIERLTEQPGFLAIRLSRNFGAHTALAAGFDHVPEDTDIVATLAADLQDPPETILAFVQEWRNGADIVWGARRSRTESTFRRVAVQAFESGLRRYAMPRGSKFQTGSFFLIDRIVLDCVRRFGEHARVTFALVAWTGFNQAIVFYDRRRRIEGRSGWTLWQVMNAAYDVFISFSPVPAKLLTILGVFTLLGSFAAAFYITLIWFLQDVQPGWTGLMATLTLYFGLLFVMLGLTFEYLYRIFVETKGRPLYFISHQAGDVRQRGRRNE